MRFGLIFFKEKYLCFKLVVIYVMVWSCICYGTGKGFLYGLFIYVYGKKIIRWVFHLFILELKFKTISYICIERYFFENVCFFSNNKLQYRFFNFLVSNFILDISKIEINIWKFSSILLNINNISWMPILANKINVIKLAIV